MIAGIIALAIAAIGCAYATLVIKAAPNRRANVAFGVLASDPRPQGALGDRDAVVPLGVRLLRLLLRPQARAVRARGVGGDHVRDAGRLRRDRDRGAAQRAVLDAEQRRRSDHDRDPRP